LSVGASVAEAPAEVLVHQQRRPAHGARVVDSRLRLGVYVQHVGPVGDELLHVRAAVQLVHPSLVLQAYADPIVRYSEDYWTL
jgi:hypothetical protein